jgi:hypothetical protein
VAELDLGLAAYILKATRPWTSPAKRDAAVTLLLLAPSEVRLVATGVNGIASRRYKIDPRLVLDLYRSVPRSLKLQVVASIPGTRLDDGPFQRIFREAYTKHTKSSRDRDKLALALRQHLHVHSDATDGYRDIILGLLRTNRGENRLHALDLVSRLTHVPADDQARVAALLKSRNEGERMNAVNALASWARRPGVNSGVKRLATSAQVVEEVRRLHGADPSADVRLCAKYYLKGLQSRSM